MVPAQPRRRRLRLAAAAMLATGGLALSSCGFDAQTLQPYNQAEGVNVDVGQNQRTSATLVKVRNLLIISKDKGSGFLSAQLTAYDGDTLTDIQGVRLSPTGQPAGQLAVTLAAPVEVSPSGFVQLDTLTPSVTVSNAHLTPGLVAQLRLTFAKAGDVTLDVPIVDGNKADYKSLKPSTASPRS